MLIALSSSSSDTSSTIATTGDGKNAVDNGLVLLGSLSASADTSSRMARAED